MDWRDALEVVVQVARAIHHAHEHGVVHRDLKPANIMLLDPGTSGASAARAEAAVKIMDFGVARLESLGQRLTRTGQSFGSPLYMSPEQALGQPSSARSDIFSLGSVLCTLAPGPALVRCAEPSRDRGTAWSMTIRRISRACDPTCRRPSTPCWPWRSPNARTIGYATAADMADDLEDVLAGGPPRHAAGAVPASPGRASVEDAARRLAAPAVARGSPVPDALASLLDEPPARAGARRRSCRAAPRRQGSGLDPRHDRFGDAAGWCRPVRCSCWRCSPPVRSFHGAVRRRGAGARAGCNAPRRGPKRRPRPRSDGTRATGPDGLPDRGSDGTHDPAAPAPLRPSAHSGRDGRVRSTESPASAIDAGEPAGRGGASSSDAAQSRIRLSVEHPFENGRLIVWIDGVLVYETKLQASVSRKIVAFKVREGRVETLLDVEPGPHEVRVEVTWDQDRRAAQRWSTSPRARPACSRSVWAA